MGIGLRFTLGGRDSQRFGDPFAGFFGGKAGMALLVDDRCQIERDTRWTAEFDLFELGVPGRAECIPFQASRHWNYSKFQ